MTHAEKAEIRYLAELVRAWARGLAGPGESPRAPEMVLPPPGLDRDRFLRLFTGHPAATTLAGHLDPSALPAEAWDRFVRALALARNRTTWLLLELDRILRALETVGCRPVVLKGAALATTVYPRPEDRWFADLDVLVERSELEAAYSALATIGYGFSDTRLIARYYEDHHFHRILSNLAGATLEVHWAVTLPASVYTYDLATLRRDAREVAFGGRTVRMPADTDQILHGVLQNIAGGFGDVRRILDLHLLDRRLTAGQHEVLAERARADNLATGLWLGYRVREQLLGEPIPAPVAACAPTASELRWLEGLDVTQGCLAQRVRWNEGYDLLLHWLCAPRRRRLRELRRFLWPDTGGLLESGFRPEDLTRLAPRLIVQGRRLRIATRAFLYLARAGLGAAPDPA